MYANIFHISEKHALKYLYKSLAIKLRFRIKYQLINLMLPTHSKVLFKNKNNKDYKFYVSENIVILLNKHLQRRSKFSFLFIADSFIDLKKRGESTINGQNMPNKNLQCIQIKYNGFFYDLFYDLAFVIVAESRNSRYDDRAATSRRPSQSPFILYFHFTLTRK